MLGKLKRVLGIEGVKLEMNIKLPINKKEQKIEGNLKFTTKSESVVKSITVKLVERYSRGRRKQKLVDEYTIETLLLDESFVISPEELVEVPFSLEYEKALSEMDKIQRDSFLSKPFIGIAKFVKGVKSEYSVVAEAKVEGTTLSPFDKEVVEI